MTCALLEPRFLEQVHQGIHAVRLEIPGVSGARAKPSHGSSQFAPSRRAFSTRVPSPDSQRSSPRAGFAAQVGDLCQPEFCGPRKRLRASRQRWPVFVAGPNLRGYRSPLRCAVARIDPTELTMMSNPAEPTRSQKTFGDSGSRGGCVLESDGDARCRVACSAESQRASSSHAMTTPRRPTPCATSVAAVSPPVGASPVPGDTDGRRCCDDHDRDIIFRHRYGQHRPDREQAAETASRPDAGRGLGRCPSAAVATINSTITTRTRTRALSFPGIGHHSASCSGFPPHGSDSILAVVRRRPQDIDLDRPRPWRESSRPDSRSHCGVARPTEESSAPWRSREVVGIFRVHGEVCDHTVAGTFVVPIR